MRNRPKAVSSHHELWQTCQLSPFICMSRQVTVLHFVMAGCGERYEKVCILLLTLTGNTFSCLPRKAFYEMDCRMTSKAGNDAFPVQKFLRTQHASVISSAKRDLLNLLKTGILCIQESIFLQNVSKTLMYVWQRWASNQIVLHQTKTKGRSQKFAPRNILKYFGWYSCSCHSTFWC